MPIVVFKMQQDVSDMNIKKDLFTLCAMFLFQLGIGQTGAVRLNADSLIALMSLQEEIDFVSGYKGFNIRGIDRLNIPSIKMSDGPMGINANGKATAFPASICMAACWNTDLIKETGTAIGNEAKSKGISILLAPGVNMYRVPQCGRNFEYYGEDPFLTSQMAVTFIQGVQSQHVMATVKHFAANNQDYDRHSVSSNIDERTLNEIYFPAFKAAVQKGKVATVMTSYNPLNGIHASESHYLIKEVLKDKWRFEGFVMSDWISVYSIHSFHAGLDLEMPRAQYMNAKNILPLIESDASNKKILDDKVRRIINTCSHLGLYAPIKDSILVDWEEHKQTARQVAREGFVLLKNEDKILPIKNAKSVRIAVIGPNALFTPHSGGGSAMIDAYEVISFFEGIKNNAPVNSQVNYIETEGLNYGYSQINMDKFARQLDALKEYDAVILCLGFNSESEGEAFDRPFALPENQEWLINEANARNPNLILVLTAGGGVSMPWLKKCKGLLFTWYPGQEGGNALGEIIFGKTNPSGKLPISIEKQWKDNAAFNSYDTTFAVPQAKPLFTLYGKEHEIKQLDYKEGIFTGYRHYEIKNIEPQFPFGFGLSFTSFKLSELSVNKNVLVGKDSVQIKLKIQNTGLVSGSEVIQLYIRDLVSSLSRPVKELKAFKKISLEPGQISLVRFSIDKEMFAFYDPALHEWITEAGDFEILVGNASNNIKLKQTIVFKTK
jgi:beta-glucosidase